MGQKNNTHGELRLDFSNVSRKWGKTWYKINRDEGMIATREVPEAADMADMTDEQKAEARKFIEDTYATLDRIMEERDKLIAQVLVDVPRGWLVDDAPDDLDWSDPENLDWLRQDRYADVLKAVNEGRSAKN